VRRALAALFGGAVGKDVVSRTWRKVKTDWDELNVLVFIHGSGNSLSGRLRRHNLVNAIGNPLETTIALSFLISDGVLERYPGLKYLVHTGPASSAAIPVAAIIIGGHAPMATTGCLTLRLFISGATSISTLSSLRRTSFDI
jgi:hypothetical protein